MDIEESNQQLSWFWNRLATSADWNSLPRSGREDLIGRVKQGVSLLLNANVNESDLQELVLLTDLPTVVDAIIEMKMRVGDTKMWHHKQVMDYLQKVVLGIWRAQHPRQTNIQRLEPQKKRMAAPASLEVISKYHPLRISCSSCGSAVRASNKTGICACCQRKGNGKENEHQHEAGQRPDDTTEA